MSPSRGVSLSLAVLLWMWAWTSSCSVSPARLTPAPLLTQSGAVESAALSPDGARVAWVERRRAPQLWWEDLTSLRPKRVALPPDWSPREVSFAGPNRLLVVEEGPEGFALVERTLEGKEVARHDGVAAPATLSPDGSALAFTRREPTGSSLVVASRIGNVERTVATSTLPQAYPSLRVAWSPDGKQVACTGRNPATIRLVEVATGKVTQLAGAWRWTSGVAWPQPGHLLVTGTRPEANTAMQVWEVDVITGAAVPLTHGLVNHSGPTATSTGQWVDTSQVQSGEVWRVALDGGARERVGPLASELGVVDGYGGVVALEHGATLVCSRRAEGLVLLARDATGQERTLRRTQAELAVAAPALAGDGRLVAWQEQGVAGSALWVANVDGTEARQVLAPPGGVFPTFGGDGTLVYTSTGAPETWKVPLDGGLPTLVAKSASACSASQGGGQLACFVAGGLGLVNPATGQVERTFRAPDARPPAKFKAGDDGLLYVSAPDESSTLWFQPLDGGARAQVLRIEDGLIYSFSPSSEGATVLVSFGRHATDAALHRFPGVGEGLTRP